MKNKFFIDNNDDYSKEQLNKIKANNMYIVKALAQLRSSVRKNDSIIGGNMRPYLLKGKLQYSDSVTGIDTNDFAGKLKFLTIALNDKSHPENIEVFKNSLLNEVVTKSLVSGNYLDDSLEFWDNFKNISTSKKKTSIIDFVLETQRNDLTAPIGLDFSKIIDTLVKTDENGNYYIENSYSMEDETEIAEAVQLQLHAFQDHPKFKENFALIENEDELNLE